MSLVNVKLADRYANQTTGFLIIITIMLIKIVIIIIVIITSIRLYHVSCHWSIPYKHVVTYHRSVPGFFGEFPRISSVLISEMIECLVQYAGLPNTSVSY